MFSPSRKKSLPSHDVFPVKPPLSSTLKSIIRTLTVSQMRRIIRTISKVKNIIVDKITKYNQHSNFLNPSRKKHFSKHKKIIMGSFRLHYNWCSSKSSHILPVPTRVFEELPVTAAAIAASIATATTITTSSHLYYDCGDEDFPDSNLAGYLQWLEEMVDEDTKALPKVHEIDMLAEMFIADSHEKFRLEKQESDRKFQEMLARSL